MPDDSTRPWPPPTPSRQTPSIRRSSVWPTGQRDPAAQLHDSGCVPGTETDRIPPAVAAHAITTYTRPGDLVLDPDCGTGTVLTEALRAGRHALGLTAHSPSWTIARANITAAKRDGAWHDGSVLDAHPNALSTIRAAGLIGRVGLILTALRTATGDNTPTPGRDLDTTFDDLATTLNHCGPLLRTGGHALVVARPRRYPDGSLVDLTARLIATGTSAGLVAVDRCIALTAGLRGGRLVTRATLAERRAARTCAAGGVALIAHHEVLVFQRAADTESACAAIYRPPPKTLAARPAFDRVGVLAGRRTA